MKWFRLILAATATFSMLWLGSSKMSIVPPLGKFLDPFHGFWSNGEDSFAKEETLTLRGLKDKVHILWDERQIPHIFAQNNHDLYLVQGYITAKQRLWQMDLISYLAAGRLAEIFGEEVSGSKVLKLDIENRKIGLGYAAQNAVDAVNENPLLKEGIDAYITGVNQYIDSLNYETYPIEYKLFDYKPEKWSPLKTFLIHKYMARDLSFRSRDREMSNVMALFDLETVKDLFPINDGSEPVIPTEREWTFVPQKLDEKNAINTYKLHDVIYPNRPDEHKGSNNWAVSGAKTKSGKPMLANDPHLGLSVPSIWFETQLINPEVNVYGVTIPGLPGIIIGFNKNIAWGVTNAEWDVVDWYEITFQNSQKKHYKVGNDWIPTKLVREKIKVRGASDYHLDVIYTDYGPIVTDVPETPKPIALRWVAHDKSQDFMAFFLLNRAKNYEDYKNALEYYVCPAQNFAFADVNGDIAMWHNGKLPIKPKDFGRIIEDGSTPQEAWKEYIPHNQKPFVKNPSLNYVSSANQQPTDKTYPYYYNGRYEHYRNLRINQRLGEMTNVTVEDFNSLLNDNYNVHASTVLPTLLEKLSSQELSENHLPLVDILKKWDYLNDADKIAPSIFDLWWENLEEAIWDEFADRRKFILPSWKRTVEIIVAEPNSKWVDNATTPSVESIEEIVKNSFEATAQTLINEMGEPGEKWQWGNYRGVDIRHLMRIPALGENDLFVGGGSHIVNATRKHGGPSWRMVVEMTTPIKAWGVYPGGQSGNPGSSHYNQFVPKWVKGELYELHYLESMTQKQDKITRKTIIESK